jgi:plastocyanin
LDSQTGKIIWQKRVANRLDAGSGATSTAGGLVFHGDPDGHLQAYDAKTGNLLWSFQTGAPANGPVSTYEINGEQYVAVGARELWAFKLGGLVPPRAAPPAPPSETGSSGPIIPSETIEIATTVFDIGVTGKHELFDEYAFRPVRTRVAPGATITWVNRGKRTHTISARDGSWTTGPIAAGRSKSMNMPKTGRYSFICREHPWSTGELIVEGGSTDPQADRGGVLYQSHCAVCHRNDLAGQEPAPQLAGFAFQSRWSGRTLGDLYDLIHTTMPLGKPNSLSGQEYLDIVKFVLSANDIPLSNKDLTADSSELRSQRIPAP